MPCYHPISGFQLDDGRVVFAERGAVRRPVSVSCGQCIGCRLERSRQWAVRCMHEASMFGVRNSFVTLTYEDGKVPVGNSLYYPHFQDFMRALRKQVKARFFMCGEYGEQNARPHYHACLFGVRFDDSTPWRTGASGFETKRSKTLEALWPHGNAEVGEVTFESAAYVARYCMKKVTGSDAAEHYTFVDGITGEVWQRSPEFCRMSLKPGIGATWFEKYSSEVFPRDRVVVRGVEAKPPRYYKKLADKQLYMDDVEFKRHKRAVATRADSTEARLAVRETVAKARCNLLKRSV